MANKNIFPEFLNHSSCSVFLPIFFLLLLHIFHPTLKLFLPLFYDIKKAKIKLDEENLWRCDKCNSEVQSDKKILLWRTSDILRLSVPG